MVLPPAVANNRHFWKSSSMGHMSWNTLPGAWVSLLPYIGQCLPQQDMMPSVGQTFSNPCLSLRLESFYLHYNGKKIWGLKEDKISKIRLEQGRGDVDICFTYLATRFKAKFKKYIQCPSLPWIFIYRNKAELFQLYNGCLLCNGILSEFSSLL